MNYDDYNRSKYIHSHFGSKLTQEVQFINNKYVRNILRKEKNIRVHVVLLIFNENAIHNTHTHTHTQHTPNDWLECVIWKFNT